MRSRLAFEISQCAAIIPPSRIDDPVHVAKACHHEYTRVVRQNSTSKPQGPTIRNSQCGSARRAIGPSNDDSNESGPAVDSAVGEALARCRVSRSLFPQRVAAECDSG
jgi:hypothetical protein